MKMRASLRNSEIRRNNRVYDPAIRQILTLPRRGTRMPSEAARSENSLLWLWKENATVAIARVLFVLVGVSVIAFIFLTDNDPELHMDWGRKVLGFLVGLLALSIGLFAKHPLGRGPAPPPDDSTR